MKKLKLKPICSNCALFDPKEGICKVVIIHEGEKINIPVGGDDKCFYTNKFSARDGDFQPEIDQIKFWVEDPKTGEHVDGDGVVKIEYPKET